MTQRAHAEAEAGEAPGGEGHVTAAECSHEVIPRVRAFNACRELAGRLLQHIRLPAKGACRVDS